MLRGGGAVEEVNVGGNVEEGAEEREEGGAEDEERVEGGAEGVGLNTDGEGAGDMGGSNLYSGCGEVLLGEKLLCSWGEGGTTVTVKGRVREAREGLEVEEATEEVIVVVATGGDTGGDSGGGGGGSSSLSVSGTWVE